MDKRLTQIWDPRQLVVELASLAYLIFFVVVAQKDLPRRMPGKHLQRL